MILVSYRMRGTNEKWLPGIAHDGQVVRVPTSSVRELLEQGQKALNDAFEQAREQFGAGQNLLPESAIEFGPPVPDPDKIICLGVNYREHAAEAQQQLPVAPMFFAKFRNSLIGPSDAVILPRVSSQIDYEGELCAVIGKRCKEVSETEALEYVAGYTLMNDISARDVQLQTSQWMAGKALDTFAPMGPGIVPASMLRDPQNLTLTTRVNGQVVQQDNTGQMIFSVAQAVSFLSQLMTLEPGDIIATGTPSGVGFKRTPPLFLKDGDVTEVEIEGIGIIRNPVKQNQAKESVGSL
ncbi:fumarylacetoacetate hydrolase family protein (plasmid) [Deinococcus radiomollis]|uniref:fumarylacetoacetate hydrolase family protein n=1 Tax=Deinococcus radiomollis TaxID=468916 RepID=UPI003891991D